MMKEFPRTCLLIGNSNVSKDNFINKFISDHDLKYEDITDNISLDYINEISTRSEPYLYNIDIDRLTIKSQNVILKFIEEPLDTCYIFLRTKNSYNIIPTIKGRCYIVNLGQQSEKYGHLIDTDDDKKIIDDNDYDIGSINDLCNSIFDNINKATLSNALTLVDKILNNYNLEFFSKCLTIIAKDKFYKDGNQKNLERYLITSKLYYNSHISAFNQQDLLSNYICELKKI